MTREEKLGVTQSLLHELFTYDGCDLYWKPGSQKYAKVKTIAGCIDGSSGYRRIGGIVKGKYFAAHRLLWIYQYGTYPKSLDHVNRIRSDNRLENLRECTSADNSMNRTPLDGKQISGVNWEPRRHKWNCRISINGKKTFLGRFNSWQEAYDARVKAEEKYYGEFAYTKNNKPKQQELFNV